MTATHYEGESIVRFQVHGENELELTDRAIERLRNFANGGRWRVDMHSYPAITTWQHDIVSWTGDVTATRKSP